MKSIREARPLVESKSNKKKIKDLTVEEINKLCDSRGSYSCNDCPYKLAEITLKFFNQYDDKTGESTTYDGYSYCIKNLYNYMNSEIEVE